MRTAAPTHASVRRLLLTLLAVMVPLTPGRAHADDITFDIRDVADIDPARPAPAFTVERIATPGQPGVATDEKRFAIQMRLADGPVVPIGHLREFPTFGGRTGFDGIAERTIVAGWLHGAHDLLVIAAADLVEPGGTGHYVSRRYLVVRVNDGQATVLRTGVSLVEGATRHVRDGGLTFRRYRYAPDTRVLTETVTRHRWPMRALREPLHHRVDQPEEGIDSAYVADIRERVTHELTYADGRLTPRALSLSYRVQERDTLTDIARHYLGPYAPASALLEANPRLADGDNAPASIRLPAGDEVRIPLPEAWIRRAFLPE